MSLRHPVERYAYAYMNVQVYKCIQIFMYEVCVCIHVYTYVTHVQWWRKALIAASRKKWIGKYTHAYMYVHTNIYTYAHVYAHTCTYRFLRMCMHKHIYMHHTHTVASESADDSKYVRTYCTIAKASAKGH